MKTNSRTGRAGFTLIELMAVITIIVILAGIVVGGMGFVNERQAKEKAKTQIALMSKAIEEYKLEMGKYPGTQENTPAEGKVSKQLYEALFYEGYDYTSQGSAPSSWTGATKIFLPELDPRTSKQGWVNASSSATPPTTSTIMDPWGNEYRYRKGTNAQNPDFDLWSVGKDGKSNTNDPSMKQSENKDDIRNF